jgi:mono/diheme cytochrome c family protein
MISGVRTMHHRLLPLAKPRLALALAVATCGAASAQPESHADANALFTERIAPLLRSKCQGCHGPRQQKADLRLDSRQGALDGGAHGPALQPGDGDSSLMIYAVRRAADLAMPPDGELDTSEVADLVAWIDAGAPWPEPADSRTSTTSGPIALVQLDLGSDEPIDFQRQVRPILSNHCFECHGPDAAQRQAGLRLDRREEAFSTLESGNAAVVPGELEASRLFQRVAAADPAHRMPPPSAGKPLSTSQIETLARWLRQGAEWSEHWSFVAPRRPVVPAVARRDWPLNPLDSFVLARLEREGIAPSPPAEPAALARRLSLDLTGLPPTPEELDLFLADREPGSVGRLIERLVASERYGEHMAHYWLDAARYADTNGYHIDNERYMWRWRDWVIAAFNDNLPYDRFTIEQLAGDLLDEPSFEQRLATGFNRNHMINFEGGAIPEEYQAQYVFDRVDTTSTVWMGLTAGCAKCHDHKFDPLSQREYYELAAFFNTVDEKGLDGQSGNAKPMMPAPTPEQSRALEPLEDALAPYEERLDRRDAELEAAQRAWSDRLESDLESRWRPLVAESAAARSGAELHELDDGSFLVAGAKPDVDVYELKGTTELEQLSALRLEALPHPSLPQGGFGRSDRGDFILSGLEVEITPPGSTVATERVVFEHAFAGELGNPRGARSAIDGNADRGWSGGFEKGGTQRTAFFVATEPVRIPAGARVVVRLRHESTLAGRTLGRFRLALNGTTSMRLAELGAWSLAGPFGEPESSAADEQMSRRFEPEKKLGQGIDINERYRDGRLKWVPFTAPSSPENGLGSDRLALAAGTWYLHRQIASPDARRLDLAVSAPVLRAWLNGELVAERLPSGDAADEARTNDLELPLAAGNNELVIKLWNEKAARIDVRRVDEQIGELERDLELNLTIRADQRREEHDDWLRRYYRRYEWPVWQQYEASYADVVAQLGQARADVPTTMVMSEADQPRTTHVLRRGQYDDPGDQVAASTPSFLPPLAPDRPADRLALARWLVDPEHPLTARVTVNRIWQRFFGTGLVATSEDFGSQGEPPSHPELLDWLATELVRLDWDLKAFQKMILESATYAQSSRLRPDLVKRDPANRLLARASRFRLDGEVLRDSALFVAGLLVEKVGGPSVHPYQPAGLWEEIGYESRGRFSAGAYAESDGDSLYRRSLYTFWKRTVPPPNMLIFDAPNRETCTVSRARTNTPLQALTTLNDPQFVEASRVFAERLLAESASTGDRLERAYRRAVSRLPSVDEVRILSELLAAEKERFAADPAAAEALIEVGDRAPDRHIDAAELAAWSVVASVVLNLDEWLTRG